MQVLDFSLLLPISPTWLVQKMDRKIADNDRGF
jgi:hypothetical protein